MAVKLRLVRMGKKKQPTYRLVAADSRSPRDGRFLEVLGTYEPRGASRANPETVLKVDNDKAVHWLRHGAQPTERVEKLLKASGAWDAFKAEPGRVTDHDEGYVEGDINQVRRRPTLDDEFDDDFDDD